MFSKDRYVACLDVLGFRTALRTIGTEKLATKLRDATVAAKEQKLRLHMFESILIEACEPAGESKKTVRKEEIREFNKLSDIAIFSDSIFVFTGSDSEEDLHQLARYSNVLFQIFLAAGLPVRGGIAFGDCVIDANHDIYVGTAITEAYTLEQSLRVLGVALHENLSNRVGDTTSLPLKLRCGCIKTLPVSKGPVDASIDIDKLKVAFFNLRDKAGSGEADRYKNSLELVSMMISGTSHALC